MACDCRKPAPGMIVRMASEHGIDPARSWMVGDILDDIQAGRAPAAGPILIDNGNETKWRSHPGPRAALPIGRPGDRGPLHPRARCRRNRAMSPDPADRWPHARRLLCVRLDQLGDVLMTTPAIRALKQSGPDRTVTLLTSSAGAGIARMVPEVDDVLVYDPPWMKATPPRDDPAPDFAAIEQIRAGSFDAAVIFTVYSQNPLPAAMVCYLAGIPARLAHCRENPYQLLTDWVRETEPESGIRHEVRRQLDLAASVGARTPDDRLSLRPPADAIRTRRRDPRRASASGRTADGRSSIPGRRPRRDDTLPRGSPRPRVAWFVKRGCASSSPEAPPRSTWSNRSVRRWTHHPNRWPGDWISASWSP